MPPETTQRSDTDRRIASALERLASAAELIEGHCRALRGAVEPQLGAYARGGVLGAWQAGRTARRDRQNGQENMP